MERTTIFPAALRLLAFAAVSLTACAPELAPDVTEAVSSQEPTATEVAPPGAGLIVLAEFEGAFDGATGEFTIEPVESELAAAGLRSVQQALYCTQRVANDGNPNSNPPNTIEIYTDPATISASASGESPAHPYCVANAAGTGPNAAMTQGLFPILGVFCANVRVSNYYADVLPEVYVAIDLLSEGDESDYAPYAEGLGNSAAAPAGLTASTVGLPALDGLWSYGNLTPRPAAGSQQSVVWAFRYARPDGYFRFRGRVVARGPTEVCGNAVDEDCDTRLNNGCGLYGVGDACVTDSDCATDYCNAGVCDGNPCTDGVRGGDESDVDCGGAICGASCAAGDLCNTDADCGSGLCREVSTGASTVRSCGAGVTPTPGQVRIAELMPRAFSGGTNEGEWFELQNTTSAALDLAGCFLDDGTLGGTDYTPLVPANGSLAIPAGGRIVIASPLDGGTVYPVTPAYQWATGEMTINNGGQTVTLACGSVSTPIVLDTLTVGAAEVVLGQSVQVDVDVLAAGNGGALSGDRCVVPAAVPAYDSDLSLYGTPGAANVSCGDAFVFDYCALVSPLPGALLPVGSSLDATLDLQVTNLTDLTSGPDGSNRVLVEAGFGFRGTDPTTHPSWLDWTDAYASGGAGIAGVDRYTATLSPSGAAGTPYDVAFRVSVNGAPPVYCDRDLGPGAQGSEDGYSAANAGQVDIVPPARAPVAGDLVITEVVARPAAGSGLDAKSEWFEVYNRSGDSLELAGCRITDAQYNAGSASSYHTIAGSFVVPAGAYAVLQRTTGIAMPSGVNHYIWDPAGATNPELANTADAVALRCGSGFPILDEVVWGTPAGYSAGGASVPPTATIEPGRSTQLVPTRAALAPANNASLFWCTVPTNAAYQYGASAASVPAYGTPGAANPSCVAVDYCRLQYPDSMPDAVPGASVDVFARLYTAGLTDVSPYANDPARTLVAQVGIGPAGSDPTADLTGWTFTSAAPNAAYTIASPGAEQNNDEYVGAIAVPSVNNQTFAYTMRFSPDGGTTWPRYCDRAVSGSNASADGYQVANSGIGDVAPPAPAPTYCRVDPGSIAADGGTAVTAAAFVYVPGLTDLSNANNPSASLAAQIGYGPAGANASTNPELFGFVDAVPTVGYSGSGGDFNNDRYERSFAMPSAGGGTTRALVARFSSNGGASWLYCDASGSDASGDPYSPASNGTLSSNVWTPYWAFLQWPRSHSGNVGSTVTWYAQMWAPGLTDRNWGAADTTPDFVVQIGYGPQGTDPSTWPAGNWSATVPNGAAGGFSSDDEYMAVDWVLPAAGNYSVDVRISSVGGGSWQYASWHNGSDLTGPFDAGALASLQSISVAPQLLITEYVEGSSSNKALEITNLGGGAVDLSTCTLSNYANGSGSATPWALPATSLAGGDNWVLCNTSGVGALTSRCDAFTTSTPMLFTGDDTVVLRCGASVIDSIGQVGFDPGTYWGDSSSASNSIRTGDRTLRRVCGASADTVINDVYAPHTSGQWVGYATDTFDGVGVRSCPGTP